MRRLRWAPAVVLVIGATLTLFVGRQRSLPLRKPLAEVVPARIHTYNARDVQISPAEARVAGFSEYLFRVYERTSEEEEAAVSEGGAAFPVSEEELPWFSLYVGYYPSQAQGSTIHSPKNCLPGAGWEALSSSPQTVPLGDRTVTVNRYLLQNEGQRALVLYWYQGRGRVAYNEYRVKLDLLADAALKRRSDEALVRIVVPVTDAGADASAELAIAVAAEVIPQIERALPEG